MTIDRAGWASTLGRLVADDLEEIVAQLGRRFPASTDQAHAWRSSIRTMKAAGAHAILRVPPSEHHGSVLEYELPAEGGRRPDVIVLQNGRVVVLEFKETGLVRSVDLGQVAAYARDIRAFHEPSAGLEVVAVLVRAGATPIRGEVRGVTVVTAAALPDLLAELAADGPGTPIDLERWINGEYRPLPTLVHAARLLFEKRSLPRVRTAESAGIPATVDTIVGKARDLARTGGRCLILVTGVPGAGKTLVGLQVAHDASLDSLRTGGGGGAPAAFLSGNGPLVSVLSYAITGRRDKAERKVFVRDLHRFVREHAFAQPESVPDAHVLIFDEAQRAWDQAQMRRHYGKQLPMLDPETVQSEPEHVIEIASRPPRWSVVVALVGTGQEIHTGEEAGIAQWADVARALPDLEVMGPPDLAGAFEGARYSSSKMLSLDATLRSYVASDIHVWARALVDDGDLERCAWISKKLSREGFPIYLTRALEEARRYARERYRDRTDVRFGLIASSKATNLKKHDLDPTVLVSRFRRVDRWFCDDPSHEDSACRLDRVASEFHCQGLELDLPVVCWGWDLLWTSSGWAFRVQKRPNPSIRDATRLRRNAYRVLLTRGRDGMVLWVPPEAIFNETATALQSAGAVPLSNEEVSTDGTGQ